MTIYIATFKEAGNPPGHQWFFKYQIEASSQADAEKKARRLKQFKGDELWHVKPQEVVDGDEPA